MTNIEIKYPVLLIREKDNNLYGTTRDIGLISKGGNTFYQRKMKMIDSEGYSFNLIKAEKMGNARLIDSIRYFQPMQQMHLTFDEDGRLSLQELMDLILEHIKKKPKHWLALGTYDMIEEWIREKKSISELIKMFR